MLQLVIEGWGNQKKNAMAPRSMVSYGGTRPTRTAAAAQAIGERWWRLASCRGTCAARTRMSRSAIPAQHAHVLLEPLGREREGLRTDRRVMLDAPHVHHGRGAGQEQVAADHRVVHGEARTAATRKGWMPASGGRAGRPCRRWTWHDHIPWRC
jgi:hypothetical protein